MKQTMMALAVLLNTCLFSSCAIGIGPNSSHANYSQKSAEHGATEHHRKTFQLLPVEQLSLF